MDMYDTFVTMTDYLHITIQVTLQIFHVTAYPLSVTQNK